MVLKAKTKFHLSRNRFYLYVPMDIAKDSQFPFKPGEGVSIEIDGNKLIIKK
jgi:hypothetical protein